MLFTMASDILPTWLSSFSTSSSNSAKQHIDNFYIELKEPHKTYQPGDQIGGNVVLTLLEEKPGLQIVLKLSGMLKLRTSVVKNFLKKPLLKYEVNLYPQLRDTDDVSNSSVCSLASFDALPKGQHRFPFLLKLPRTNLPTSVDFNRGSIDYSVSAEILRSDESSPIAPPASLSPVTSVAPRVGSSSSFSSARSFISISTTRTSSTSSSGSGGSAVSIPVPASSGRQAKQKPSVVARTCKTISVVCPINVARLPRPVPTQAVIPVGTGVSSYIVTIPEAGYLRGDQIPVKIYLKMHKAIRNMSGILITLSRISRFSPTGSTLTSYRKDLTQVMTSLVVNPETLTCEVNTLVPVPTHVFPTSITPMVSFRYFVETVVNLSSRPFRSSGTSQGNSETAGALDPSKFIDTDKLKHRRKVLSLWREIVIGTSREENNLQVSQEELPQTLNSQPLSESDIKDSYRTLQMMESDPPELPRVSDDKLELQRMELLAQQSEPLYEIPGYE